MKMERIRTFLLSACFAVAAASSAAAADAPPLRAKPTEANAVWTSGTYAYDGSGNIITIGADTYRYDLDGRLVRAAIQTPTAITQQFVYDALGNLTSVDNTPGVDLSIPVNPATNQVNHGAGTGNVASAVYDEAGNQTQRNAESYVYTYDGTAMVTRLIASSRNERYLYDADDQRIAYVNSNASGYRWRYTVRDADGRFVREYTDDVAGTQHTWHWTQDYVYASSRLVGSFLATGTVEARRNFHLDHLGTPRLTTAADGTVLSQQKLLPFGEEAPGSTADKSQTVRFTGHERDYASGADRNDLDYMHARYYAPKLARFLSVDPTWGSAELRTPQSWNRYSYVLNNPIGYTDPDGRCTDVMICAAVGGFTLGNVPGAVIGAGLGLMLGYGLTHPSELADLGNDIGKGESSGERYAERQIRENNSNHMAEKQEQENKGTAGGDRAGKRFTSKGKQEIHDRNAEQNGGENRCEICKDRVEPGKKSEKDVTPPRNERQADHIIPKSKGGDGSPSNGQTVCRGCNLDKRDKMPNQ